jgi:uncharacterized RDD family membrane protein YckC
MVTPRLTPPATAERRLRHPWRRLLAWWVDWLCIMAWAAVIAVIAVPLYLSGALRDLGPVAQNVVSAAALVIPVSLAFAVLESSRLHATLGKRVAGLTVVGADGTRVGFWRALLRNLVKIAVPWAIGHAAVYALTGSSGATPTVWLVLLTAAAYVLPTIWLVTLFVGAGRTPYDRLSGTGVTVRLGAMRRLV